MPFSRELVDQLFYAMLDHTTDHIYFKDTASRFICINRALARALGLNTPSDAIGKTDADFFPEEFAARTLEIEQEIIQHGAAIVGIEEQLTWPNGRETWVLTCKWPFYDSGQKIAGCFGISRDVTEQKLLAQKLRVSEERFTLAILGANDGVWDWDLAGGEFYYSERLKNILGYSRDDFGAVATDWFSRIDPEQLEAVKESIRAYQSGHAEHFQSEHRVRRKDGRYCWTLWRGWAIRDADGQAVRMAGSMSDISELKEMIESLKHSAYYDRLTDLPNRYLFTDRLNQFLIQRKRYDNLDFAVFFLDLDHFKRVNDTLGHQIGDELLKKVAQRLLTCVRKNDTVARHAGDEFTILLERVRNSGEAEFIADRIRKELSRPFELDEHQLSINTSIGILFCGDSSRLTVDSILRDADIALYHAKQAGRGCFMFFNEDMRESFSDMLS